VVRGAHDEPQRGDDEEHVFGLGAGAPVDQRGGEHRADRGDPGRDDPGAWTRDPPPEQRERHDHGGARQAGEHHGARVRVAEHAAREPEYGRDEGREVQFGVAVPLKAVALDQRHARAEVGGLVGGGGVVGQPDGDPQGEAHEQGRGDPQGEPVRGCPALVRSPREVVVERIRGAVR
jgi:hypothetical protein